MRAPEEYALARAGPVAGQRLAAQGGAPDAVEPEGRRRPVWPRATAGIAGPGLTGVVSDPVRGRKGASSGPRPRHIVFYGRPAR
jgi:hypothetical protein